MELAFALKKEFGDRFNLYGGGWKGVDLHPEFSSTTNQQEAEIYRTASIAINCSHFNYGRYSSDRLLRELGSGCFVLTHNFKDLNLDYEDGKHLVSFDGINDLILKCNYYLNNPDEAERISKSGCEYVHKFFTWDDFVINFKSLINHYKNARTPFDAISGSAV